jgi:hypothetical protein
VLLYVVLFLYNFITHITTLIINQLKTATIIQAYYGDHWLFTNIERKATLEIEIFQ